MRNIDRKLIEAARSGDAKSVEELLSKGANVKAAGWDGGTALHHAKLNYYTKAASGLRGAEKSERC